MNDHPLPLHNPFQPPPSLRPQQSFSSKVDEGYSGEEIQTPPSDNDHPGMRDRSSEVKIPAWMTGLNDTLREEYAYKLVRTLPTSHIASLVDRLVPILHRDFIQILPSELSLQILSYLPPKSLLDASLASKEWRRYALEPSLWKHLYRQQGWEADESEVRKFEEQMQSRAERQSRQEEETKDDVKEPATQLSATSFASMSSSGPAMSQQTDALTWIGASQEPTSALFASSSAPELNRPVSSFPGGLVSDDEDMYPSPNRPNASSNSDEPPPLTIAPTLTTPGYAASPPRLNWAFLFKNRRKLDDNWLHNRCTPFQIPHPNYIHEGHRECIYTIQYSPKWLCSGSRDKTIRVWNIRTRRLRGEPLQGHNGSVLCLQFDESPEEDVIISGSSDTSVIVWRFSTGEKLQVIPRAHEESVLNLRFNKKWLITCSKDKLIKIWNRHPLETQDPEYPWNSKLIFGPNRAPLNHPHHPQYTPNWTVQDPATSSGLGLQNPFSQSAAQAARNARRVQPKNLTAYTACNQLPGHAAAVNAIQLRGNEIVSASGDRAIKLWNLTTGLCEKTFIGHDKGIACIQFDGKTIVSGSSDQTIRVFDRDTQAEIATLRGHSALVRTVQATENKIVSGSYDESVRIWRKEEDGSWAPGPVLRQAHTNIPAAGTANSAHLSSLQQFTAAAAAAAAPAHPQVQASVQMHHVQPVGAGMAGAIVAAQLLPNHYQSHQHNPAPPPPPAPQVAQPPPQHTTGTVSGAHRVFKLQFDARWIICCSQDTRIVGWDYANDEEGIVEASRFFKGG